MKLNTLTIQASILMAVVVICVTILLVTKTITLRTAGEIAGFFVALTGGAKIGEKQTKPKE